MIRRPGIVSSLALLLTCALILTSCFQRPYRLRYLSFEKVDGITVESRAEPELENLMLASKIPVAYSLERPGYSLVVEIERTSFRPRARFSVRGGHDLRLVARPRLAMRPGRAAPCGGYDEVANGAKKLLFSWSICGDDAAPSEYVVAFDVVDATGVIVREERLPFELKRDGIYWATDSL